MATDALTLAEVLSLDVFRRAEAEVVAGAAHLGRRVRWVHISEVPDIAYLLKGGELLLTTGVNLPADEGPLRAYVRELTEAGVAGLVIELGRRFSELPPPLIDEAAACELPVIALHREIRYVDVTEELHGAILGRQYERLRVAERLGRTFTDLVLRGAGVKSLLQSLATLVQRPVVLEDAAHQVVEYALVSRGDEDHVLSWDHHSRRGHGRGGVSPHRSRSEPTCVWVPIRVRGEWLGAVHVLETSCPLDDVGFIALDRAAAAVGTTLLSHRHADHLADRARDQLISDIVGGRLGSARDVQVRARALGAVR